MDIINEFDLNICNVLDECKERVNSYHPCIRTQGIEYMKKLNILGEKNKRNCDAYWLIPFWLKDTLNLEPPSCHTISLATVYMVLYFLSQDEVMDASPNDPKGNLLPLSSMFYYDFISHYRTLFTHNSSFWAYMEEYINEWAQSVLWESKEHIGQAKDYTEDDFILLSRKAAGLKIPFAAACILADREDLIPAFSKMMDCDQIVYQLYDDWRDWREDMAKGSYTYFLVEVMKYCNINPSELNESYVKKAVFEGKIMQKVFKTSRKYNQLALESISHINSPYLKEYLAQQAQLCIELPERKILMEKYGVTSFRFARFLKEPYDEEE